MNRLLIPATLILASAHANDRMQEHSPCLLPEHLSRNPDCTDRCQRWDV